MKVNLRHARMLAVGRAAMSTISVSMVACVIMLLFSSNAQAESYRLFLDFPKSDFPDTEIEGKINNGNERLLARGMYNADIGKTVSDGSIITLGLFGSPIEYVISRVTRKMQGRLTYSGSANPDRRLTVAEHDGRIVGSLHHDGMLYKLRPGENGETLIIEVKPESLVDHDEDYTENDFFIDPGEIEEGEKSTDSSSEYTVIVAYTSDFASDAGDVAAYMDLLQEETNTSYANSQVNTSVRIVHYYQTSYSDTGSFSTDLSFFAAPANSEAQQLRNLRDQYHADIMILLTGNSLYGSSCGLARDIGATADNALAAAREGCAAGYYSFGHEIGHLFGARHIITQDSATTPYSYGHGYCNVTPYTWRTVMAYNCPTGTGGNRIQQWSNPYISINGEPTGSVDVEYNALVMNVRAEAVANFRVGTHTLTFTRPVLGTITGTGIDCGITTSDCSETYATDSLQNFTLSYDSSVVSFNGWTGDAAGAANPLTVTMDADKNIGVDLSGAHFPWNLFLPAIMDR